MSEHLIELRRIVKRYGTGEAAFNALGGIDLTIDQGEFVAIMGPSGSGKSTTMNIIGALDSPTSGEYLFQGLHVETLTNDERALLRRRFMGFVFRDLISWRERRLWKTWNCLFCTEVCRLPNAMNLHALRSIAWAFCSGRTILRQNSRAVSNSAWPLREPSSPNRFC